ncbi:MAG: alpha/beta fold hydrolase, partial [Rhodanobacteraceae bacterium]
MTEFVLIHGSWHGAWRWDHLKRSMEACGDQVEALTFCGLGERADELRADVNLSVHADDVAQRLAARSHHNAVLVAHSYAGMTIARIASHLRDYGFQRVVLLDAFVPVPGESALDVAPG